MRTLMKVLLALTLAVTLLPSSFGQAQQAQPPDPTGQAPSSPAPTTPPTFPPNAKQEPETAPPQTSDSASSTSQASTKDTDNFLGTIVSRKGSCMLRNGDHEYKLDDQAEASKHKDQKVKVTGSLDQQSNTIHVEKIEEAPES